MPLRAPHRLDLEPQAVVALDKEDATVLVLQGGGDKAIRALGSFRSQFSVDNRHESLLAFTRSLIPSHAECCHQSNQQNRNKLAGIQAGDRNFAVVCIQFDPDARPPEPLGGNQC